MIFTELKLKGQLPEDISWSSKLSDFEIQREDLKTYDFGTILPVGEIEILNQIKGLASCRFDKMDNFSALTLTLVDHNNESSQKEFERVKNIINGYFGNYYLETEPYFYQTQYCWNTKDSKLKLWKGCVDRTEINSVNLIIENE